MVALSKAVIVRLCNPSTAVPTITVLFVQKPVTFVSIAVPTVAFTLETFTVAFLTPDKASVTVAFRRRIVPFLTCRPMGPMAVTVGVVPSKINPIRVAISVVLFAFLTATLNFASAVLFIRKVVL